MTVGTVEARETAEILAEALNRIGLLESRLARLEAQQRDVMVVNRLVARDVEVRSTPNGASVHLFAGDADAEVLISSCDDEKNAHVTLWVEGDESALVAVRTHGEDRVALNGAANEASVAVTAGERAASGVLRASGDVAAEMAVTTGVFPTATAVVCATTEVTGEPTSVCWLSADEKTRLFLEATSEAGSVELLDREGRWEALREARTAGGGAETAAMPEPSK